MELHSRLKVILNNDDEYERLSNLVKAENNTYDRQTEVYVLQDLNRILQRGFDSHILNSASQIRNLSLILDNI